MQRVETELDLIKQYYGKILRSRSDLQSGACCSADGASAPLREVLALIDDEILDKFYGCGSPIPPALDGCAVVDLGCGTGRDAFIASYLTGQEGICIGVDMTDEQLSIAQRHVAGHMVKFGYERPNVFFKKGYIEDLGEVGIDDDSVDVVISNCVINLSPDKRRVFSEIARVLKPGGELYFSDVFAGRRVPESVKSDPVLYGECLGGALYIEDFRRLLRSIGIRDYRVVSSQRIMLDNPDLETKAGMVDFYSMTVRAFKLDDLEDICEDYGQTALYHGTITGFPHTFVLDDHHTFVTGKPMLVCGNTATMLEETRFARHFSIRGDRQTHYGPFACAPASSAAAGGDAGAAGGCC